MIALGLHDFLVLGQGTSVWLDTNHFQPHFDSVVDYLNLSSPIANLDRCRRVLAEAKGSRVHSLADGPFVSYRVVRQLEWRRLGGYDDHWYHYNQGGIDELQFNFGMHAGRDGYYRIGIGFNLDDPFGTVDAVKLTKHVNELKAAVLAGRQHFEGIVARLDLKIETEHGIISGPPALIADHVINDQFDRWYFIGRLLYVSNPQDNVILGTEVAFRKEFSTVFSELAPYWCRVVHAHRGINPRQFRECDFC